MSTDDGDMCPICKSSRYLNPDMRFLVNPECYHKMCESCVDRIFAVGPAPCPYPGCGKTLRKNKFKKQVFEDLSVEREVDVRQRVGKTFNKREQDFNSLQEYNDYLEEVENIVFNLVNQVDVEQTEAKLQAYEQANRSMILSNALKLKQESELEEQMQNIERERRKQALELTMKLEQDQREIRKDAEKEVIRQLATSKGEVDANAIKKRVNKNALKRSSARQKQFEQEMKARPELNSYLVGLAQQQSISGGRTLYGSASASPAPPMTPFTPFRGDRQTQYPFKLAENYYDPATENANKPECTASGFSIEAANKQWLVQAFFGLSCNIQSEKA